MVSIGALWMPILLSAVGVFLVSSVVHMVLPFHRTDYTGLEKETEILDALRGHGLPPGEYMFPHADSMQEAQTPEMIEKFNQGPVGIMTVWPNGMMNMGKALGLWFGLTVVLSFVAGYCASMAFGTDASGMDVFRMTFVVAFVAYGTNSAHNSIWKGQRWSVAGKFLFDGLLYATTTGALFAWLWPSA